MGSEPRALSRQELLVAFERVLDCLAGAADEFNRLDSAVGDGDLGITMTLGCRAVRKQLPELASGSEDIGSIVAKSGMAFNRAASSTIGALFAIGAMRAGKEARDAYQLDLPLLARMVRAAEAGIMERGQAHRGDKTLLDALGPSADALDAAVNEGRTLLEAAEAAAQAAREGLAATIPMRAKSGRSAWIPERSVGQPDPGATVILQIWEAFVQFLYEI
jgi:dihydroxyacetone kinase-like protein